MDAGRVDRCSLYCLTTPALPPTSIFEAQQRPRRSAGPKPAAFDAAGRYPSFRAAREQWSWRRLPFSVEAIVVMIFTLPAAVKMAQGPAAATSHEACLLVGNPLRASACPTWMWCMEDGPTSLQFRKAEGGFDSQFRRKETEPSVRRRGTYVILSVASGTTRYPPAFCAAAIMDPVYVGLGGMRQRRQGQRGRGLAQVELRRRCGGQRQPGVALHARGESRSAREDPGPFTAPSTVSGLSWSGDGGHRSSNSGGRIYRLPRREERGVDSSPFAAIMMRHLTRRLAAGHCAPSPLRKDAISPPIGGGAESIRRSAQVGMAGRPTAPPWPTVPNATANSMSTRCP
jgi:hypothetical protein